MQRHLALAVLAASMGPASLASAQEVTFLGAFDGAGKSVSVAPLDALRLEYCFESTSAQRTCSVAVYELSDGIASFVNRDGEPLAFDLVTNVLTLTRADGTEFAADMTPVAR